MTETDVPMNDLCLADFAPWPQLVVARHEARRAKFPAIDAHNHFGRCAGRLAHPFEHLVQRTERQARHDHNIGMST